MLARQVGVVLCRVGAAVLIVQAIRTLGYVLPGILFGYGDFVAEFVGLSLLSFVPGLAAIGLWVFADRISNVPGRLEYDNAPESLRSIDIIRVGTALIGVYLVVTGVTSGVNVEVTNFLRPDLGSEFQSSIDEQTARTIGLRASYLVQILLGLALFLGRDRLSASISEVKGAGIDKYQDRE